MRSFTLSFSALAYFGIHASASNVWTVNCAPLTQQRSDPIQNPGKEASHVHAVVGSTAFSRSMNGDNAAENGWATTCDKATDHSSYWAPQLYSLLPNNTLQLIPFTGMVAYYTNYTCDYNPRTLACPQGDRNPAAFPPGLRMIAGDSNRRTLDKSNPWQAAILMESGNDGEVYGMPKQPTGRFSAHARFPSCWDGQHKDSDDHQSHVAYPDPKLGGTTQGGMCPSTHPHALINIGAEFGWNLAGVSDVKNLVWANGDATGYGFHADFIMGWTDPDALQQSFANCFSNDNCPWRKHGSPTGVDPTPKALQPQTPPPFENIGLQGLLGTLPGNNPFHSPR